MAHLYNYIYIHYKYIFLQDFFEKALNFCYIYKQTDEIRGNYKIFLNLLKSERDFIE